MTPKKTPVKKTASKKKAPELPARKIIATDVPRWVAERIKEQAVAEKRSFSRQLELIITRYVEENLV